jgi:HPt (histidine-containing phosphotransfer) domain-containing protein
MDLVIVEKDVMVDFNALKDLLGLNYKNYQPIIELFLKNIPTAFNTIEKGIHTNNWEEVFNAAHSAKSSLSIIKINQFYETLRTIELNAKHQENLDTIPSQFFILQQQWLIAETLIKNWLHQLIQSN